MWHSLTSDQHVLLLGCSCRNQGIADLQALHICKTYFRTDSCKIMSNETTDKRRLVRGYGPHEKAEEMCAPSSSSLGDDLHKNKKVPNRMRHFSFMEQCSFPCKGFSSFTRRTCYTSSVSISDSLNVLAVQKPCRASCLTFCFFLLPKVLYSRRSQTARAIAVQFEGTLNQRSLLCA